MCTFNPANCPCNVPKSTCYINIKFSLLDKESIDLGNKKEEAYCKTSKTSVAEGINEKKHCSLKNKKSKKRIKKKKNLNKNKYPRFFFFFFPENTTKTTMETNGEDLCLEWEEPGNREPPPSPNRRDGFTCLLDIASSMQLYLYTIYVCVCVRVVHTTIAQPEKRTQSRFEKNVIWIGVER